MSLSVFLTVNYLPLVISRKLVGPCPKNISKLDLILSVLQSLTARFESFLKFSQIIPLRQFLVGLSLSVFSTARNLLLAGGP